jgi:hypothetical protein
VIVERTRDARLIKQLATDPRIFPYVTDDHHPNPNTWEPLMSELVVNLIARDSVGAFGFAIFIPRSFSCYATHVGFLPRSYGRTARRAFERMIGWMWTRTQAARLTGEIAIENRRAIAFAKRAGFVEYGVNRKSFLRGGSLRDQVCLGLSKPGIPL